MNSIALKTESRAPIALLSFLRVLFRSGAPTCILGLCLIWTGQNLVDETPGTLSQIRVEPIRGLREAHGGAALDRNQPAWQNKRIPL